MIKIKIAKRLGVCLSLLAFSLITFSTVNAQARLADITTAITPIPSDSISAATLLIPYGSANSDLDIRNSVASATVSGSGFIFDTSGFQDLYYGSPLRTDAVASPAEAVCTASYSGPTYNLNSSLASTTSWTYGLQSARNTSSPSGTSAAGALPSGQFGLRQKSTGCIKIQVLLAPGAVAGQNAVLTFDEDSLLSQDYQESRRPGKRIFNFSVTAPTVSIPVATPTPTQTPVETPTTTALPTNSTPTTTLNGSGAKITPRTGGEGVTTGIILALLTSSGAALWYSSKKNVKTINLR